MKRQEIENQWDDFDCYDIYDMSLSEVSRKIGKNYKGRFETNKDGSKIYRDEVVRIVICDKESVMYRIPINPLTISILCPIGARFKQDERGRDLYDMKAQIHSIDDSQFGIWFKEIPYATLEYMRKQILEYVDENYFINGEDFLTFCELMGGVDKDYN